MPTSTELHTRAWTFVKLYTILTVCIYKRTFSCIFIQVWWGLFIWVSKSTQRQHYSTLTIQYEILNLTLPIKYLRINVATSIYLRLKFIFQNELYFLFKMLLRHQSQQQITKKLQFSGMTMDAVWLVLPVSIKFDITTTVLGWTVVSLAVFCHFCWLIWNACWDTLLGYPKSTQVKSWSILDKIHKVRTLEGVSQECRLRNA